MRNNWVILAACVICAGSAQGQVTSTDNVKASATATKPDAHGVQLVTITLDIEKGVIIYANPVNHNNEFLNVNATRLKINAKIKPHVDVKYPSGRTRIDGKDRYDIYDNTVTIQATVKRTPGDASPLQIDIRFLGSIRDSV